ncbi:MAG TPA: hypothetical protein VLZ12_07400, partial [Verrucomicrobiae bacterium]|nr:hypothetical protein [Verrucomicrobiae bacterium]
MGWFRLLRADSALSNGDHAPGNRRWKLFNFVREQRPIRALVLSALVCGMVEVCPSGAHADEAIISDDATVAAVKPTANTGPSPFLKVIGPLDERSEQYALLKFDLSGLPA